MNLEGAFPSPLTLEVSNKMHRLEEVAVDNHIHNVEVDTGSLEDREEDMVGDSRDLVDDMVGDWVPQKK